MGTTRKVRDERDNALKIILASASPRRRELLGGLGLRFEVVPASIDESEKAGESAVEYVERLGLEKAHAVGDGLKKEQQATLVIAADTIVELDGELLGKPEDPDQAKTMLGRLSGVTHRVHTGVAALLTGCAKPREQVAVATTQVSFHPMTPREIDWYVATGEPMDKAGAYGIQNHGGLFVAGLSGSYFNVVGLPVDLLYRLVGNLGIDWNRLLD